MAKAGCIQIDIGAEIGAERGSDAALKLVKKGITIDKIKQISNLCHKYGIRIFANFLVNLPNETTDDLNDIVKLIEETKPEIVSLNIFTPYPGTEIYGNAKYYSPTNRGQ